MLAKQKSFSMRGKKAPPSTPDPRSGHIFLVSENAETMYVVGGHTNRGPQTDVWSYQPNKELWKLLDNGEKSSQSPLPRFEYDGCLVGPFIYLFGGFQSDGKDVSILNDLWVFDLEYQTWNLISEECCAPERSGHVVVAIDSARFIVHGGTCMGSRDDLWLYDTSNGHWEQIISEELPCARSMHSAVFCQGSKTLALFGGVTHHGNETDEDVSPVYLNDLWVMHLGDCMGEWRWNMVLYSGFAPSPRDLPALVAVANGVILFGGFGFVEISDDLSEGDYMDEEDACQEAGDETSSEMCEGDNSITWKSSKKGSKSSETDTLKSDSATTAPKNEEAFLNLGNVKQSSAHGSKDSKEHVSFEEGETQDEGEEDGDDDSNIAIDYLSDAWYVNLESGESTEIDLCSLSTFRDDVVEGEPPITCIPRRGCKLISANNGKIISFGGFDGENFYGKTEELSIDILNGILSAKVTDSQLS